MNSRNISDLYEVTRLIGNGAFGSVFEARDKRTREVVAIKKVLQDRRYRNREHQILRHLRHPNIVGLKDAHLIHGKKDLYLYLVMECMPETISNVIASYARRNQHMPDRVIKVYAYQLIRGLSYLRNLGVCHRDIKPQNILVNMQTYVLKVCDFGSAKKLVQGEPNVAYICSRYYRAPELIYGAQQYTPAVDLWSAGCVIAELYMGRPLFAGSNAMEQMVEIVKILGMPTAEDVRAMNPQAPANLVQTSKAPVPLSHVFPNDTPRELIDLLSHILVYQPGKRYTPMQALCHPYFDELRQPSTLLPNGVALPPLFDISSEELIGERELAEKLIPKHARNICPLYNAALQPAISSSSDDTSSNLPNEDRVSSMSGDALRRPSADVMAELATC